LPAVTPDPPSSATVAGAARDYLLAVRAIHVVEGSTDVHHHGGMAGAALTPHCAWECGATVVRYVNVGGVLKRIVEPPPHGVAMAELGRAEAALVEALRQEPNPD